MKTWKKILVGLGLIMILLVGAFGYVVIQQKNDIDKLQFSNIDMNLVNDGLYDGHIETTLIKVEVRVKVENHVIKDITILKHENGLGGEAEAMIKTMKEKNSYDVDTVSGATLSSKVIKSAVNQALEKGL